MSMPKSPKQKLKRLFLMQMLLEKTVESHPLFREGIISGLAANGIVAERKSIYDDVESLRLYGLHIGMTKAKPGEYFIARRDFELPERKLLVDSIQSSQFTTEKRSCN